MNAFRTATALIFVVLSLTLISCGRGSAYATKPPLPVAVTYRNSLLGKGYVGQFHNISGKYLTVLVVFTNKTLNIKKTGSLDLPAYSTKEIGWQEGWKFTSGETIDISNSDYETLHVQIP